MRRILRRGTWSTIYLGEHIALHNQAVLKVLHSWVADESVTYNFYAEARLHASLLHPHIVRVLDFGTRMGDMPFFVMDYATQGALLNYLPVGHKIPAHTVLPFVLQIADALQYMHDRNLIHRAVKPQNILVGAQHEALLTDFGIAMALQPMSKEQAAVGTAMYAAPEQIRGQPVAASDQYALAVMVYMWLCGRPPFEGDTAQLCRQHLYMKPVALREQSVLISEAIEQVVMIGLEKDPLQRFPCVQDFALALEHAMRKEPAADRAGKVERITEIDPRTPPPCFTHEEHTSREFLYEW